MNKKYPSLPSLVKNAISKWQQTRNPRSSKDLWVLDDLTANLALAKLFWNGCDPVVLLDLLANSAGIGLDLPSRRGEAKTFLKRLRRLGNRLQDDAKEVREVFLCLGFVVTPHGEVTPSDDFDLPNDMEDGVQYLRGVCAEHIKSTVLSRGGGLQAELVDAVRLVTMATGRPRYGEIADLLSALTGVLISEDDVRKRKKNFESNGIFATRAEETIRRLVHRGNVKWSKLRRNQKLG